MNAHLRYWLFQIPGLLIASTLAMILYIPGFIGVYGGLGIVGAWFIKDLILYPITYKSYGTRDAAAGVEKLIDQVGAAAEDLTPEGYIRVQGELWKARTTREFIGRGQKVRVTTFQFEERVLLVEPVDTADDN